jgi:MtN3 and saliva related transmembrane protein
MNFSFGTVIGIVASLLTSFSYVPQVRKMWRRKSAGDVSNVTIFQMSLGCLLWLGYGISRTDYIIIGSNVAAIFTLVIATVMYYRYRVKDEKS